MQAQDGERHSTQLRIVNDAKHLELSNFHGITWID